MSPDNENLWVVGIGASAGGLEALQSFVSHLDPNVPAAFIIAQHLAPHTKSLLVELLSRKSALPVKMAVDGEKIQAGHIYVVPPNHDVETREGQLVLNRLGDEHRPKPSVDNFFETLSRTWGDRSVGIVLSGTGSDGSQGIRFIRAAGGLTFAQDDLTARYDGMPKSAVETGSVDIVLSPDEIARELENFLLIHSSQKETAVDESDLKHIREVLETVKEATGQDFTEYKTSTIRRRIDRQMRSLGFADPKDYIAHLKENPKSCQALAQEALISVTTFFRDQDAFEALDAHLEKNISSKQGAQEYRVWVAGCATGEEAYSLAISINELMESTGKKFQLKMFATDLDQEALLKARSGYYKTEEVHTVPAHLLNKYFQPRGEGYEVRKSLRDSIIFARQDLIQSPPFVKVDLVACRNVLIYFEIPLQKKVFEIFHYSLNPNGILFLGKSESTHDGQLFEALDRKLKIYKRLNVVARLTSYPYRPAGPGFEASARRISPALPIEELIHREVLNKYIVSGVVIDEQYNIIHIIGKIADFVSFPEGHTHINLTTILGGNAGVEIPVLVRRARIEGEPQTSRAFIAGAVHERFSFHVEVRPLKGDRSRELYLILFEKHRIAPGPAPKIEVEGDAAVQRLYEMEQELSATKEHLQTVVEELGVSNEELQSLNEELSSTNEELQASNEQLETTNEELQSSNEELTTLNEELLTKSAELRAANLTLENIQESIVSPLIVVDSDLRIIRFNGEIHKIFELTPRDLGKDITRVTCNCEILNFHDALVWTLEKGKTREVMIESQTALYQLRISPFFDERRKIIGAILVFFDNTQLIRAEERLRLSESRTRAIIESSPSLIWTKDSLGRYLTANQAFADFFKVRLSDVIGKTDRDLFPPALAEPLREGDLEILSHRNSLKKEERFQWADGEEKVLLATRFPLMEDEQANPYAVGTVAIDITKQVEMQKALAANEARYKSLVEDQTVFVCRFNPDWTFTFVNRTFSSYFGGLVDSYHGQSFFKLMDPKEHVYVEKQLGRISPQFPVVQFEHSLNRFGDSLRWIRWIVRGQFNAHGGLYESQAVGLDVTENRKETDRLQERESLFSEIFAHTSDYLSVFKVHENDFVLESFNRSTERNRGYNFAQYFGRTLSSLLAPERREPTLQTFRNCMDTREPQVIEEAILLPGGRLQYLSTTLVPVMNIQGEVERIASISRDISSLKAVEEDLRMEKERAELASRSKTDFLASMSHELRTPLNIILGMSDILKESIADTEHLKYIGSIERSGRVLLALIEDILDLSKIEAGKLRLEKVHFNLTTLINEIMEEFKPQAEAKKLEFKFSVQPNQEVTVMGDPSRLRQVLTNLLSNALKFTDSGGIELKIFLRNNSPTENSEIEFQVHDTGVGIPKEEHSRLFEKFSQVDSGMNRKYGGTGLGLAISKRIVQMMGGRIGFESSKGRGSNFWFVLPLDFELRASHSERRAPAEVPTSVKPSSAESIKILVVDDNNDTRHLMSLILRGLKYSVHEAASGEEALRIHQEENFDVILMDIQMPGMDGMEATRRIRNLPDGHSKVPIIACTANAMAGDKKRYLDTGMTDYISKPVDKKILKTLLEKWGRAGKL